MFTSLHIHGLVCATYSKERLRVMWYYGRTRDYFKAHHTSPKTKQSSLHDLIVCRSWCSSYRNPCWTWSHSCINASPEFSLAWQHTCPHPMLPLNYRYPQRIPGTWYDTSRAICPLFSPFFFCSEVSTRYTSLSINNRLFAENWVASGFLYSVSYIKPIPTLEKKYFAVGKKWPKCHFLSLFFSWVGFGLELGSSSVPW